MNKDFSKILEHILETTPDKEKCKDLIVSLVEVYNTEKSNNTPKFYWGTNGMKYEPGDFTTPYCKGSTGDINSKWTHKFEGSNSASII